jgi:hypothetical protein
VIAFDDPAVADEAILPFYTNLAFPAEGGNVVQKRLHCLRGRILRACDISAIAM